MDSPVQPPETGGIALRWFALGGAAVVAVALGFAGFSEQSAARDLGLSALDRLYLALQLFTMESGTALADPANGAPTPLALEVARYLAPGVAVWAALQAAVAVFNERFRAWRLRGARGHVVVCGLGRKGLAIAQAFATRGRRVVVIERDAANPDLELCRRAGMTVLVGSADEPRTLAAASAGRAGLVFAVCGNDAVNAEIALRLLPLGPGAAARGTCHVHVNDPELCMRLRQQYFPNAHAGAVRLEFFNIHEMAARAMFDRFAAGLVGAGRHARIMIAGVEPPGDQLAALAAREAWLAARQNPETRLTLLLTGTGADRLAVALRRRLGGSASCEVRADEDESKGRGMDARPDLVLVCRGEDRRTLRTALEIQEELREALPPVPVVAAMGETFSLARFVDSAPDSGLHAFNSLVFAMKPEILLEGQIERTARWLHETYRRESAKTATAEQIASNPAMRPWDDLSEDFRQSNRDQAENIAKSLAAVGVRIVPSTVWEWPDFKFETGELETLARGEHDRWMRDRTAMGWRHGEKRDNAQKLHPDLLPWEALPEEVREKDRWFVREWPVTLARAGFRVERASGEQELHAENKQE